MYSGILLSTAAYAVYFARACDGFHFDSVAATM